jgi:hypothetical protein
MVLLRTTEKSGACFIRTDQLDGETDWKLRRAVSFAQKLLSDDQLPLLNASIYGEYIPIIILTLQRKLQRKISIILLEILLNIAIALRLAW